MMSNNCEVNDMTSIDVYGSIDEIRYCHGQLDGDYQTSLKTYDGTYITLFLTQELIEDLQFSLWAVEVAESEHTK